MTDDIHTDAAAFAIGALEPEEEAAFERHLVDCPDCRREVAETRATAAELAAGLDAEPPAGLRDALLARIADTPQDRPESDPASASTPLLQTPGRHAGPSTAPAAPDVVPLRRSWRTRASALVAAAAVIAAVAVGGWAVQSRNDARDETAAATEQVETLTSLLAAPDVQTASTEVADGGTATVVRSAAQGRALLVTADLPELPSDRVYEAWTIDGDPVAAGTFEAGETPHLLPEAAVATSTVAVTVEPAGGSDAPTTEPIAVIDLST